MENVVLNYYDELKLQGIIEKNLKNADNTVDGVYFSEVISFFGSELKNQLAGIFPNPELLTEWILRTVKLWEDNLHTPNPSVCSFIMQLLSFVSVNDSTCDYLQVHNIYNRVINIAQAKNNDSLTIMKLSFIKLMRSMVYHRCGQQWLLKTNYWQNVLSSYVESEDDSVTERCLFFMTSFLDVNLRLNEDICSRIWWIIVKPLLSKPGEPFENRSEGLGEQFEELIGPTVHLVNSILQYFFEKGLQSTGLRIRTFKNIFLMSEIIQSLTYYLDRVKTDNLTYEMGRMLIMLLYSSILNDAENGVLKVDINEQFIKPVFSLLNALMKDSKPFCVLKCSFLILVQWSKLTNKIKIDYVIENNKAYIFEDQFLYVLMFPTMLMLKDLNEASWEFDSFRDLNFDKLYSTSSPISIRLFFKWRELLPFELLTNTSLEGISYILQLVPSHTSRCVKLIFPILLFLINDINSLPEKNPNLFHMLLNSPNFMVAIFRAFADIISYFNDSSRNYIAFLRVFEVSSKFLMNKAWPPQLIVEDLKVIRIAIKRYLSSNLTIQFKETGDCVIVVFGSFLRSKLSEDDSAVKQAALEVITTIAEAASSEWQPLRKLVLKSDLNKQILNMCVHDGDSSVRATALKTLYHLVHVEEFWEIYLEHNTTEAVLVLLKREKKDIVRAQAVRVLKTVFTCCAPYPHLQKQICEAMCRAVLEDSDRTVRLHALAFWNRRVVQKLIYHGMLDDQFPEYTFSFESKKIVRLTDAEIKKRLVRVLDDLTEIGCLKALNHAVSNDFDVEVSEEGWKISKKLNDLIDKYGVGTDHKIMRPGAMYSGSLSSLVVPMVPQTSYSVLSGNKIN